MTTATHSLFNLKLNLGALEVGSTISSFLLGITASQAYTYYQRYPDDPLRTRLLVALVLTLEFAHTIATAHSFFTLSIVYYDEPARMFTRSATGYTLSLLFSGLVASIIQAYFAERIRRLTGKVWLASLCWLLSFLRFLGSIGLSVLYSTLPLTEFSKPKWRWTAILVWSISAAVDILIAVTLSVDLINRRKEAIRLKRVLDRVIAATIQTGVLTSMTTVTIAICYFTMPRNFIWGAVGSGLAKLYSISLFSSLNARDRLNSENIIDTFPLHVDVQQGGPDGVVAIGRLQFRPATDTSGTSGPPQHVLRKSDESQGKMRANTY